MIYLDQLAAGSAEKAAAASILEDAAARTALLRLVAAVVRWPLAKPSSSSGGGSGSGGSGSISACPSRRGSTCGSSSGGNGQGRSTGSGSDQGSGREGTTAYVTVARHSCNLAAQLLISFYDHPQQFSPAALDFVRKLLRMDTLQCLARQFSAAAAAAAAGALTTQQVEWAGCLSYLLASLLCNFAKSSEAEQLLHADMVGELAAALRDSCVMEHWARFLLLLLQGLPASDPAIDTSGTSFLVAYDHIAGMSNTLRSGHDSAVCAVLRGVLSGRCARHVALAHGVAALCVADGGPSYGLPEDVLQAISGYSTEAASAGHRGVLQLPSSFLTALIAALAFVTPSPPVGTRAAVLLLLRLARLAVTSADVWAAHATGTTAAHAGAVRVVVDREQVAAAPFLALPSAWILVRERLVADPPAWAAEAGVECWRLVAAVLGRNALCWASLDQLQDWGDALLGMVPLLPAGEPLPPAPPPDVAVVLAGGLLPCLERLLRRAGEERDGPESAVVGALRRYGPTWQLWAHLLEYGEPQQTAALVATLGKLLRRAVSTPALVAHAEAFSANVCVTVLMGPLLDAHGLVRAQGRQLARLLVYALHEWLPALSGLALEAMAGRAAPRIEFFEALLYQLLLWLPLLACRCGGADGAPAWAGPPAAAAADAAGSSAADDAVSWRMLLLEEVRVVPLLAAVLRLAQPPYPGLNGALRPALAQACCAVGAAFPDEVLQAANSSAWLPDLLCVLGSELRAHGHGAVADGTEALAKFLAGGGSTGGGGGGSSSGVGARERLLAVGAKAQGECFVLAAALVPPVEARSLLRTCSYRGCTNLAGDSEADARMQWCRFCNVPCYCCGECQLLHWQEGGHKEACPGGAKARPG
ncbi:hypothetical protein TSOC_011552 [Tetrabaena socialis]|uniref:phytol kinase n=1 Tax=Tetrabaena socialis TaxID=47790 RepID=A0A2J7ZQC4_9CHLO|nr:hypothetical protein TSOC_011552 [Tetrabaena socialis]|eukprot:PNH02467.1 hypothetical protein TSOC_011552 [Tetrabaena socialis]